MGAKGSQPTSRSHRRSDPPPGILFLVGVPIGHPDDITIRALHTLRTVSCIASENPQATQSLLQLHGISATITSYDPRQLPEKIAILLDRLKRGQHVALVSDCGMPVWFDPGHLLVRAAYAAQVPVRVIPGPSAVTAACALSGFSGDCILIESRLHETTRSLPKLLARIKATARTTVIHIPSRDLLHILNPLSDACPDRNIVIAADVTKAGERILRGKATELRTSLPALTQETDVTIVIEGIHTGRKQRTIRERERKD